LRIERREKLHRAAVEGPPDPAAIDSRWLQAFLVVLYCRMLHTLETGTVVSKKAASQWALAKLDARWQRLIASSVRFEAEVFSPEPADPDAVALAKAVKCSWCGNDRVPKGSYHASLSSPLRSQG
jgi:hypothetical protein